MWAKLQAFFGVFRAGGVVADPAKWKSHQVKANQVISLLAALVVAAKVVGYDTHMDNDTVGAIGAGLFALVNWLFTVASTDKIGITGIRPAGDAAAPGPNADIDDDTRVRASKAAAAANAEMDVRGGP